MDQGLITLEEARAMLKKFIGKDISRSTLSNYIKRKGFPNHIGIGWPRLWRKSDILTWMDKQALDI